LSKEKRGKPPGQPRGGGKKGNRLKIGRRNLHCRNLGGEVGAVSKKP